MKKLHTNVVGNIFSNLFIIRMKLHEILKVNTIEVKDNETFLKIFVSFAHDYIRQNESVEQLTSLSLPTSNELLTIIFCNCNTGCGSRYGYRKSSMHSTLAFGH